MTLRLPLLGCLLSVACALPDADLDADGFSVGDGDCDDLVATVHPDSVDVPGDGVDQDCDGRDIVVRATGLAHGCELDELGEVLCYGDSTFGQAEPPDMGEEVVDIAAGSYHTCALMVTGDIHCWGLDRFGQASPPEGPFDGIGAGGQFSMGRRPAGQWVCWGACVDSRPIP